MMIVIFFILLLLDLTPGPSPKERGDGREENYLKFIT